MKVTLDPWIYPGEKAVFTLDYLAQVPAQIRRNGRNSAEGIEYSLSQWYPKVCHHDADGWHPNPYVMREFFPVWGGFPCEAHPRLRSSRWREQESPHRPWLELARTHVPGSSTPQMSMISSWPPTGNILGTQKSCPMERSFFSTTSPIPPRATGQACKTGW